MKILLNQFKKWISSFSSIKMKFFWLKKLVRQKINRKVFFSFFFVASNFSQLFPKMSRNFLKFLLKFALLSSIFTFLRAQKNFFPQNCENFSLLRDLSCEVAADELAKHPEMRTILLVELRSDFPKTFSAEILKCLPPEVAKLILKPQTIVAEDRTKKHFLPKESLVIYVMDEVEKVRRQF